MSLIRPIVSEKSLGGADQGVYSFRVAPGLEKLAIKRQVEKQFGVTVVNVNTATVPGKTRRRGRVVGRRPGYKKATVTLKKGDKIKEFEA